MRKTIILILFVLFSISIYLVFTKSKDTQTPLSDTTRSSEGTFPESARQEETSQELGNGEITFSWLIVRDTTNLTLYSNLEDKLGSRDAMQEKGCLHLVNAGFYMPDDTHPGLFVSEGELLSAIRNNSLFNGYFSVSFDGIADISGNPPESTRVALQTGPILMQDKKSVTLSLSDDKPSRRVVLAIDKQENIVFVAIYTKGSVFDGPNLKDLPNLLNQLNENSSLDLVDAINLDGGTASAFISDSVKLTEFVRIGSYFCVEEGLTSIVE